MSEPLTQADVESWKALKSEVCMYIKNGQTFWLVPEYTGKDRVEISIDDFLKQEPILKKILETFPESRIETIIKAK
jgi:hypothetical protein